VIYGDDIVMITVAEQRELNISENQEKLKKLERFAVPENVQRHTFHCYSLYHAGILKFASLNMTSIYHEKFVISFISHDGSSVGSIISGSLTLNLDDLFIFLEKLNA